MTMCSRPPDSWGSVAAAAKVAAKEIARVRIDLTMMFEGMQVAIDAVILSEEKVVKSCLHD